ncbi:9382_t:CDS:2, partial [Paraglomus brasilianum]
VKKLSSDFHNAELTLEASPEEISRLVSASMEKYERLLAVKKGMMNFSNRNTVVKIATGRSHTRKGIENLPGRTAHNIPIYVLTYDIQWQSIEQTLNRAAQYYQDLAAVNHNNEICKRDSKIHELESKEALLQEEIQTLQNTLASITDKRKELGNNSTSQITRTEVLNSLNDGKGFLVGNEISAGVLTQALDNPKYHYRLFRP